MQLFILNHDSYFFPSLSPFLYYMLIHLLSLIPYLYYVLANLDPFLLSPFLYYIMIDSCPFPLSPLLYYVMIHLSFPYPTFDIRSKFMSLAFIPFLYFIMIHLPSPEPRFLLHHDPSLLFCLPFILHYQSPFFSWFISLPLNCLSILRHDSCPFPFPPYYSTSWFIPFPLSPFLYYVMIHLHFPYPLSTLHHDPCPFPLSPFIYSIMIHLPFPYPRFYSIWWSMQWSVSFHLIALVVLYHDSSRFPLSPLNSTSRFISLALSNFLHYIMVHGPSFFFPRFYITWCDDPSPFT